MTRDGPRGESPREEAPPTSAVGARLREAREKRGLSEEAASREAGLPLRYLKMLEEGRFPTVADPAYLTHFLQRYARFLGLDPGATTRSFLQETEPETASRRASRAPMAGRPPLLAHPGRQAVGRNLLVSGALLAAAIGGVFAFVRSRQEPEGVAVASLSRGAPQAARNVTRQPAGSFEDMPASRSAKELPAAPARGGDLLGTSTRPPSVAAAPAPAASAANPRSEAPRAAASLPAELSAPSGPVSPSGSPDALAASPEPHPRQNRRDRPVASGWCRQDPSSSGSWLRRGRSGCGLRSTAVRGGRCR